MERIQKIIRHKQYQFYYQQMLELEADRMYCHHTIEHFLAVARIVYIRNLEMDLGFSKELIYAAALLHDIGKGTQYLEGVPHEIAAARITAPILKDCGFDAEAQHLILSAVKNHRKGPQTPSPHSLDTLLFEADKQSRNCFFCEASKECHWDESRKSKNIDI